MFVRSGTAAVDAINRNRHYWHGPSRDGLLHVGPLNGTDRRAAVGFAIKREAVERSCAAFRKEPAGELLAREKLLASEPRSSPASQPGLR